MRLILSSIILLGSHFVNAQCTSTGATNGSIFYNNLAVGTVTWNTPSNATSSDNVRSISSVYLGVFSSANTYYLLASGYGFSIPALANICGIKVDIEKRYQTIGLFSSVTDNSVKIVKGGVVSGAERASGSAWSPSDAYSSYGSNSDLWGLTWTPSDINNANFGVAISAKLSAGLAALTLNAEIDHIRITVFYNVPLPVTFKAFNGEPMQDKIKLSWTTATESNSSHFIPEKLNPETKEWEGLGRVPASFNSSTDQHYESFDNSPGSENFYRIKEVDRDNRFMYSKTISVQYNPANNLLINTYPNPAREFINIHSSLPIKSLRMIDISGKELLNTGMSILQKDYVIPTSKFPRGMYYLIVQTGNKFLSRKIIIDK
ncbi:MAG: T9SS type A sorting domain-containing protein [Bacteroidetes bacterium]|nr:T9SS type A sorting domain-containing protein [Bacteroidota bacterium]MBS1631860.1 T9SS type A sorting domain-containing protein [Bacteroidota bacterium]